MSAQTALAQGRRFAESIMLTTCTVSRATGETIKDPVTLEKTPVTEIIYSGACMVMMTGANPANSSIPGAVATDQATTLFLPVGAAGADQVTTDDIWECIANPTDPALIGKRANVEGTHDQTFSTRYAYPMQVPS